MIGPGVRDFSTSSARDGVLRLISHSGLVDVGPVSLLNLACIKYRTGSGRDEDTTQQTPLWESESDHRRLARHIGQSRLSLSLAASFWTAI
jgi:hypothetical protein